MPPIFKTRTQKADTQNYNQQVSNALASFVSSNGGLRQGAHLVVSDRQLQQRLVRTGLGPRFHEPALLYKETGGEQSRQGRQRQV